MHTPETVFPKKDQSRLLPTNQLYAIVKEQMNQVKVEVEVKVVKLNLGLSLSLLQNGGGERDRTDDPLRARQVLSQLSYTPISGSDKWWA